MIIYFLLTMNAHFTALYRWRYERCIHTVYIMEEENEVEEKEEEEAENEESIEAICCGFIQEYTPRKRKPRVQKLPCFMFKLQLAVRVLLISREFLFSYFVYLIESFYIRIAHSIAHAHTHNTQTHNHDSKKASE